MAALIFRRGLCGHVWVNIVSITPKGAVFKRSQQNHFLLKSSEALYDEVFVFYT